MRADRRGGGKSGAQCIALSPGPFATMDAMPAEDPQHRAKLLVNLGSGPKGTTWLPGVFADWRALRVDADPKTAPDLLADITDLTAIETGAVDAVWSAHCLEHLYLHQVAGAIAEMHRILSDDGFLCLIVPDLQVLGEYIVNDRLHEVVYQSAAGPVSAHDIIFGYGPYLARGFHEMAHRCGFTPALLVRELHKSPFAEIILRRRPNQELAALARKRPPVDDADREALLASLEL
jgi:SAM-dependent methyltransferase